ncbi:hypothetical protein DOT_0303 [Desulfosporosinus sp. OT]|nr:hypothetical protein DOT_0303 [Desulfosporosinus sp. OT]
MRLTEFQIFLIKSLIFDHGKGHLTEIEKTNSLWPKRHIFHGPSTSNYD